MNRTFFTKALLSAFAAGLLLTSCQTTSKIVDFTVDKDAYFQTEEHSFNEELLLPEDESYLTVMKDSVEPYIYERMESGKLDCTSGHSIYWETFKCDGEAKGTIVIFHGFCEYTKKYNEHTYYFLKSNYNVVRFDHQGHGKSSRKTDNPSKVYTEDFDTYVSDADEIIKAKAVPLSEGKPLYLYAHSMGGGIGGAYLERHPEVFTKAVLNCPMMELNSGKFSENGSLIICRVMRFFGQGKKYIPGNGDFNPDTDLTVTENSIGPTVSIGRSLYYRNFRASDEDYRTNGATYGWTDECISGAKKARSRKASKIQVPVLMFQSENDRWVRPNGQYMFRSNSSEVTLACYPEVEHAIYASKDQYLYEYYDLVLSWFEK